jgi:hypothetical protein
MLLMLPASRFGVIIYNTLTTDPKDVNRNFMSSQRISYPLLNLRIVWSSRDVVAPEKGTDDLAIPFIRKTDHADFSYSLVIQETLFNLSWEDVFAAWAVLVESHNGL